MNINKYNINMINLNQTKKLGKLNELNTWCQNLTILNEIQILTNQNSRFE